MIEYESHCHGGLLRELVGYSYQVGFFSWEIKTEIWEAQSGKKKWISEDWINSQEEPQEEFPLRLLVCSMSFVSQPDSTEEWV